MSTDDLPTSVSLLARLHERPRDQHAWSAFVTRYGGLIQRWCRGWGLQESDAQDVTQNVLLELSRQMQLQQYRGDGRFRGWLRTIAYRAWCDYAKRQRRPGGGSGESGVVRVLNSIEAREDFLTAVERECDRELLEIAMQRVKARVQPHTWEAFRLMTFEGLSGADTAARLQMKTGSVFVAKSRVDRMLSDEVTALDYVKET